MVNDKTVAQLAGEGVPQEYKKPTKKPVGRKNIFGRTVTPITPVVPAKVPYWTQTLPKIEHRQEGGPIDPDATTVVGEDGPELIRDNNVIPIGPGFGKAIVEKALSPLGSANGQQPAPQAEPAPDSSLIPVSTRSSALGNALAPTPEDIRAGSETSAKPANHDQLQFQRDLIADDKAKAAAKGDLVGLGTATIHENQLEKANPLGSAANHPGTWGKIAHGLATAGNIAGNLVGPSEMSLIPGTDLNRQAQENRGEEESKLGSALKLQSAETRQRNAATHAMGQVKPKEEEWSVVPGATGANGELIQQEKNSGQMRYAPLPGATGKPKGNEAVANDEQLSEYQSQIPSLTPFLNASERVAYAFPKGYKPIVAEISSMKKDASSANAAALAGNREARAAAAATAANNKKSLEENVIDGAAKSISSMDVRDLSPLKDIASLRGDQRLLIYQKAKELNPNFNTAEVQRKVKMLDQFTDGKDGQNLQSFGTFFEHAGELSQAINDLRNFPGAAEVLNKPWNWFENHTGDPRVIKFLAAAEPVKKEFESFLLNNRALYESDRKSMDEVLNGDMSPAKFQGALKTMGQTATARYTEMNQRFKNTVGTSIDDAIGPMSDESLKNAARIGITKIGSNTLRNGKHGYGWYEEGQ
jgi:hypothetical protein